MTIDGALRAAKHFRRNWIGKMAGSLQENRKTILRLQKDQLLSGVTSEGVHITPSYAEDPFFKKESAREAYIKLKEKRESRHNAARQYVLFGNKGALTPNLIQASSEKRSQFHRKLKVSVSNDTISIRGTWSKSPNVESKYPTALGLTQRSFNVLWDETLNYDVIEYWNETFARYKK